MRHALTAVLAAVSFSSIAIAQTPAASVPATPAPTIAPPAQSDIGAAVAKDMDGLMTLYRDLHANPELSLQEVNTAAKLAKRLKALKYDVTEKVGGTGVVAVMKNGSGPVLLIRADMDGLPVVDHDATTIEVAAVMARMHSPLVAVVEGDRLLGAITVSRLLEHWLPASSARL